MSITTATVLRIAVSLLLPDDVIAQNIINMIITGGSDPYDEDDVVSDVKDYLVDLYADWAVSASDEAQIDQFQVYEYDPVDDDWDEVGSDTFSEAGDVSDDMMPHGVAAFTQGRTLDPDVSGAKYWPAFSESAFEDGTMGAGTITATGTLAATWVDPVTGSITGAALTPGVWSVVNTNFFPFNGVVVVNAVAAYQRRRKPGVGS